VVSKHVRALVALALLLVGCGGTSEDSSAPPATAYEVRGMVRRISADDADRRQIWIHHEPIDDFVGLHGQLAPMDAMTMPFEVAPDLDLTAFEPGDKVRFRLEVDWSATPPAYISSLQLLPPGTDLSFE
jgi:Cu/Ag efflux protein CusF